MASPEPASPAPGQLSRARVAIMVAFAVNGAMPAAMLARYAEVKDALELTTGFFGLVIAAYTVGAALTFHLPGVLLRRFGTKHVAVIGTVTTSLALTLAGVAVLQGSVLGFMLALLAAGYSDSIVDVAQNAQGLQVEHALGKSALTMMHAGWSAGAAIGGGVGTLAASLGVPLVMQLVVWAVLCTTAMAVAGTQFLQVNRIEEEQTPMRLPRSAWKFILPITLVAVAGIVVEDLGNNWSAVLLAIERNVDASQAGVALAVMLGAQFVGRLFGDSVINRFGRRPTVVVSLVGIALALNVIAWAPNAWLTIGGFAIAGLACAVTVPIAYAQADTIPGLRAHAGVTLLAWIMRSATIGLTPLVGGLSAFTALPIAISLMSLFAIGGLIGQLYATGGGRSTLNASDA